MDKIEWKQLNNFLNEDSSLTNKITYEQFLNNESAPTNTDIPLEEVYNDYLNFLNNRKELSNV